MSYGIDIAIDESAYISACIAQEEWALKKVYEDHYATMLPVCMRYASCEADALDILQDGFIKVFRSMSKYHIGTSLASWIHRIMVNTSIDYYRREKRRRTESIETAYSISTKAMDAISSLNAQEIIKALQLLSPAYRAVFNLYVIEGYSHKEVATKLRITESTSRANLVKARTKLKKILSTKGFDRYGR